MKALRILGLVLAGTVLLLIAAVAGGVLWLRSEAGRNWLVATAEAAAASPDLTVGLDGVGGTLPFDLTAARVTVADSQGTWLTLEDAAVRLDPWALFGRQVRIDAVTAAQVTVERAPVSTAPPAPEEPATDTGVVPDLPVSVVLERLAIDRLRLGAALAGEPAELRVGGAAWVEAGGDGASARLDVERTDDRPGTVSLDAAFVPADGRLDLDLTIAEPPGGMIARAAGIPGLPAVQVRLEGKGPLDDWRGTLVATAQDAARLTAQATVTATPEGHSVALAVDGDVKALVPPALAPLLGDGPTVAATALIANDGGITVRPATVTTAAATVGVSGTVAPGFAGLDLAYQVTVTADSPLHGLVPAVGWGAARLSGTAAGPLDALSVAASAAVERVVPPGLEALAGPVSLEARGLVDTQAGRVALDALELATPVATAAATGTVTGWGQGAEVVVRLAAEDLSRFAALTGRPLAGAAAVDGTVTRGADGMLTAALDGRFTGFATGTPADPVLGPAPTLTARATMAPDGAVRVPTLRLAGAKGELTGAAGLVDGRVSAETILSLPELAPVGAALATPLSGAATITATVEGPTDALSARAEVTATDLTAAGRALGRTRVVATADALTAAPSGRIEATVGGLDVDANAAYALAGQTLSVSGLSVAAGANTVTGSVRVALDTMLAEGRLEGTLPALRALSDLAGMPLSGEARVTLAFDGKGGRQAATLTAAATGLRIEGDAGPLFAARSLNAEASVTDALGTPSGTARLVLSDASAGGTPVARAGATVEGSLAKASFSAEVDGGKTDAPSLQLAGTVSGEGELTRIRLERLQAGIAGETLRLAGPATIALGPQRTTVSDLRLTSNGAQVTASGGLADGALNGTVRVDRLPLALARLADPSLRLEGVLNAGLDLGGTLRAPRADLTLRVDGARPRQLASSGVPGADADVRVRWRDRRVTLDGTVTTGAGRGTVTLKAAAPLVLDPQTMAVAVPSAGAVEASADGRIDLALLDDVLAASGDRARGTVRVDVRVDGTVAAPRLGGSVELDDGRYENRASGAVLTGITARIVGDGQAFAIRRFEAKTANGGTVQARGTIRPPAGGGGSIDVTVTAVNARLMQTDMVTATVGADLSLAGAFDRLRLSGRVKVEQAEVQLPNRMPASVVDLDVTEVGRTRSAPRAPAPGRKPGAVQPQPAAATPDNGGMVIALDVTVNAPNQIYIRGRGLDVELGGTLMVAGTAEQPRVTGRLQSIKGGLSLIGQTFSFTRFVLDFDGTTPPDPRLDVLAEATANGVTAQVNVTGTAANPKLTLSSAEGLPQDEVLSRVLFGKPVNKLGAGEAVQLAQSAAALTGLGGSGGGLLDRVRRSLGVDRLDFVQGENGKGGAVEAGRYLADDVYVGVEQGVGTGQTRAKVEVDITDNIKGEADVGSGADTRFGLKFEWDY